MTAIDNAFDLEDLSRRYDAQVLREYLLEQDDAHIRSAGDTPASTQPPWTDIHELRPRCFKRLRVFLALNFVVFWAAVVYCGYVFHQQMTEHGQGLSALPTVDTGLSAVLVLGTQGTAELAAVACLSRPLSGETHGVGFRRWDGLAWLLGFGVRGSILLDAMCLPLIYRASSLLFALSLGTYVFAIGIFVFGMQLRLLCGLFRVNDHFSYDKPDLFFAGRDNFGMMDGPPVSARLPTDREEEESDALRLDRSPPVNTIKVANFAHFSDMFMLHTVLVCLYTPLSCRETQEFIQSATSFSRCFCEDVVQCILKFFYLVDYEMNALVLLSFFVSAAQAVASCLFSSTPSLDIRNPEESGELTGWPIGPLLHPAVQA